MSSSIPMPRTIVCKELDSSQHDGLVLVATSSIFPNCLDHATMLYQVLSSKTLRPILLLWILIVRQQPAPCCHHWGALPCSEAWQSRRVQGNNISVYESRLIYKATSVRLCFVWWSGVMFHPTSLFMTTVINTSFRDVLLAWVCPARGWSSPQLVQLIETGMIWGE